MPSTLVPRLDRPRQRGLDPIEGQPPDLTQLDRGCSFRRAARFAIGKCAEARPPLAPVSAPGQLSACFRSHELDVTAGRHEGGRHDDGGRRRTAAAAGARPAEHFPVTEGLIARRHYRGRQGGGRRRSGDPPRRNLGLVGESGCRQDDDGPLHPAARKADCREILYDGVRHRQARPVASWWRCAPIQVIFQVRTAP